MEMHRVDINYVLGIIQNKWQYAVDEEKSTEDVLVLRLPFSTKEEVDNFRFEFSRATCTEWVQYYDCSKQAKCYHRAWKCHLSSYRKSVNSKRNVGCSAKLDIVIKNITLKSRMLDIYLMKQPPLVTVVTIGLMHNHTIRSAAALKLLRVSEQIKNKFFAYFNDGIMPGDAITLHENELLCLDKVEDVANASLNPTARQVYHLYGKWKTANLGSCKNPFNKLKEKFNAYEQRGATVIYLEDELCAEANEEPTQKETLKTKLLFCLKILEENNIAEDKLKEAKKYLDIVINLLSDGNESFPEIESKEPVNNKICIQRSYSTRKRQKISSHSVTKPSELYKQALCESVLNTANDSSD